MKKLLSIVLILLMAALPVTGMAEQAGTVPGAAETPGEAGRLLIEYDYDHLVVGNTTPFNGRFFTGMWGR